MRRLVEKARLHKGVQKKGDSICGGLGGFSVGVGVGEGEGGKKEEPLPHSRGHRPTLGYSTAVSPHTHEAGTQHLGQKVRKVGSRRRRQAVHGASYDELWGSNGMRAPAIVSIP